MSPSSFGALSKLLTVTADVSFVRCLLLLALVVDRSHGGCIFPESWTGAWFQSGMPQLMQVNSTHIENKGQCVATEAQDKFVLYDRNEDCYRCMVIHEKHTSVLQYKETYCSSKETLPEICDTIGGDAQLYSMFRKQPPPQPQSCPFRQPPFHFTYSRGGEECSNPPSKAESCTVDSRLLLRYQACPDVSGTESNIEELVCLATWKEGSTRYLVGQVFQGNRRNTIVSDEDSYRCFVYKGTRGPNNKVTYDIAQSGDATCNGLTSPTDGSRTISLTTSDDHHKRCHFPPWITEHHKWISLDKKQSYHFTQRNATLKITNEDTQKAEEVRIVCHSILMQSASAKKIQIVAHYTRGCDSGHVCMVVQRREGDALEIQRSSVATEDAELACAQGMEPHVTLLSASPKPSRCPRFGRYAIEAPTSYSSRHKRQNIGTSSSGKGIESSDPGKECSPHNHYTSLQIGCGGNQDSMEFKSNCATNVMHCHGFWSEEGRNYAVVTPVMRRHGQPTAFCAVYTAPDNATGSWSLSLVESSCERVQSRTPYAVYNLTMNGTCAETSEYSSKGITHRTDLYLSSITLITIYRSLIYYAR